MDHLGLIAATLEKIGLINKIEERLPIKKSKTIGQPLSAVISFIIREKGEFLVLWNFANKPKNLLLSLT